MKRIYLIRDDITLGIIQFIFIFILYWYKSQPAVITMNQWFNFLSEITHSSHDNHRNLAGLFQDRSSKIMVHGSTDCNSVKLLLSRSETDDKSECQKEQISQFDIVETGAAFVRQNTFRCERLIRNNYIIAILCQSWPDTCPRTKIFGQIFTQYFL